MMSAKQVAVELGISARMVYDLHHGGRLVGYRFGRVVRFDESTVSAYKESCKCQSVSTNATSAGASNLTALLKDEGSALASYFRKVGVKPRLKSSTAKNRRASTPLQLAYSAESR